jgi:DNA polymerase-3 subunit alpha
MAVIMLEDAHGSVEVVIFPEAYGKCASVLETGAMVVVTGRAEVDEETMRMTANEVMPIEAMRRRSRASVVSSPRCRTARRRGGQTCSRATAAIGGRARLELRDQQPPVRVRVPLAAQVRVRPSDQLATEVERICGAGTVVLR